MDGRARDLAAGEVVHVQTNGFFSGRALEDGTWVLVTLLNLSGGAFPSRSP